MYYLHFNPGYCIIPPYFCDKLTGNASEAKKTILHLNPDKIPAKCKALFETCKILTL
jgi:hypothetical protein